MVGDIDMLRAVERAPLRTMRLADAEQLNSNAWRALNVLCEAGALTRLAKGVYTAPPDGHDARTWKPTLEATGLALATARFGNRNAILMGLGAARHWAAIPRAIGDTTVAVPAAGRAPVTLDRGGTVHLIPRDLDRLEAVLERTELGQGLVTTPAQTLFDLLRRPHQGGEPEAAAEAVRNLATRVRATDFRRVMNKHPRGNDAVRGMLMKLEDQDAAAE